MQSCVISHTVNTLHYTWSTIREGLLFEGVGTFETSTVDETSSRNPQRPAICANAFKKLLVDSENDISKFTAFVAKQVNKQRCHFWRRCL